MGKKKAIRVEGDGLGGTFTLVDVWLD